MDYLKGFIIISFICLLGIFIGSTIYKESVTDKEVFNELNEVYIMQYGVYSNEENMKNNTKELSNYMYYKDDIGFHVIIGIVENKDNSEKIKESYGIKDNIYIRKENINNMEFIMNLKQYDKLISNTDDKNEIINAEKQILSKYEELILNNE